MGEFTNVKSERDDPKLNAEAKLILRYATVADLKADAAELSELFASLSEPERARLRALVLGDDL